MYKGMRRKKTLQGLEGNNSTGKSNLLKEIVEEFPIKDPCLNELSRNRLSQK